MSGREWLDEHRDHGQRWWTPDHPPLFSAAVGGGNVKQRFWQTGYEVDPLLSDVAFNNHDRNDGSHVSPFDNNVVQVGLDGLEVQLLQGINEEDFKQVLARGVRATTGLTAPTRSGVSPDSAVSDADWQEMLRGGLRQGLETQVIVFEVWGASRALTHQLVRSRRAGFLQQSQRATWYGDRPEVRMPESIWRSTTEVRKLWVEAVMASWAAYSAACDAGVSYQDARYILTEGTTNYIQCQYTVAEFINVFAYRGCSMFLWEMVGCMRKMRDVLLQAHPFLEPYVKISCEKGQDCESCEGKGYRLPEWPGEAGTTAPVQNITCPACNGIGSNRKCTFQGWENVEQACTFPWARQSNRVFLPDPKFRIGEKS